MTFQKILVALDQSSQSALVFETALDQAIPGKSKLLVLHSLRMDYEVQTGPFLGIGTLGDVNMYGTLKHLKHEKVQHEIDKAQEWLRTYEQQAIAAGIATEVTCHVGDPGPTICELAQSWQADLIILGRRGHRGLAEVLLGSVSNYVIHHAPCSVLVVQDKLHTAAAG